MDSPDQRQRVALYCEDGQWSVERRGPHKEYAITLCRDEAEARAELHRHLKAANGYRWQHIGGLAWMLRAPKDSAASDRSVIQGR